MTFLLPAPFGCGTHNNSANRDYLRRQLHDIDYRTCACASRSEAAAIERTLLAKATYRFNT